MLSDLNQPFSYFSACMEFELWLVARETASLGFDIRRETWTKRNSNGTFVHDAFVGGTFVVIWK